ncbi:MAG: ABC transporter permease [Arthrobacter sp.]|uniref:ABC transporter permease n=1 Tax=unclassified Arthrobacter TaxID=235627 RepID=UPI00264A962D|nr:ABC transporter permease [Micrococcaceae bacterium]MDN5879174.1 ABC transporter permease [Micrococcaceae bacterium]MDN5886595.1 ABC transporter permease [Micrococcaceae bacterium]MDN6168748.1 ABC transporter permease [Micrococcaceae bacterium]MDN6299685.1 ABC transporter permease [Micrococcaceae bacterium]
MSRPNPETPSGQLPEDLEAAAVPEEVQGLSQNAIVRKRFMGNTPALISIVVFALIFVMAFSSIGFIGIPGWWHYSYEQFSTQINGGRPTFVNLFNWGDHPFGQDRIGRDYFAMTMRGTQQSIVIMFVIGSVGGFIGVVVGALSGYFRGWIEAVLMRIVDIIIIVPLLILAAVLGRISGSAVSGNMATVALGLFIGVIIWTGLSRLVRGEFLTLREREFVDAAHIAGASNTRIMFKHILPNAVGVIIVNVTLLMAAAILLETALSYLGLGVKAPDVSLGSLISDNQEAFSTRPWLFWFPGLFIVVICLSINFIGDGLRDAFDPRQRKFKAKKAKDRGVHGSAVNDSASAAAIAQRTEGGEDSGRHGSSDPDDDGPAHGA